eukprot:gnl/MRDRNA2_/MRDRNA2_78834_c0_seq1.p1 gnl/MRDRNA2_/MRDRNA2_78834_c0~~gnl/MRDRNA2_/MRDRNA2_78834_c0_seq1.p1  ORF type:complete len:842 (+),score=173.35 gnl/MRDRNA2_/MRDRNA2_78834_c0_seq1:105-2528(+)
MAHVDDHYLQFIRGCSGNRAVPESGVLSEIQQPPAWDAYHKSFGGKQRAHDWKPKLRHQQARSQWHQRKDKKPQFQREQPRQYTWYQDQDCMSQTLWQKHHMPPPEAESETAVPKENQKHHVPSPQAEFDIAVPQENQDSQTKDVGTGQDASNGENGIDQMAGQELLAMIRGATEKNSRPDENEAPPSNERDTEFGVLYPQVVLPPDMVGVPQAKPYASVADAVEDYKLSSDPELWAKSLPPELWAILIGDETLQGPDGELYDVFYPHEGDASSLGIIPENEAHDSFYPYSDGAPELTQPHRTDDGIQSPSSLKLTRASSAEDCLGDLLQEMHHGVLERYPVKQQLFSAIHTAAETALGAAFARLALVGSTAMQVDTPTSDLDVVVFTRPKDDTPQGVEALRWIAAALRGIEPSLRIELIDCAKVPILVATTANGDLSIDVSVDQPLAESHVLWFQMQHELPCQGPLHRVPTPAATTEWGHHAALCRVLKWWLSRRAIPGAKEGGYPSLVWLLMAMHSVRCSLFVDQADAAAGPHGLRHLLGALGAFFDRFSRPSGFWGAIVFADGMHSEFWLHRKAIKGVVEQKDTMQGQDSTHDDQGSLPMFADFAVFDPARPEPADLAVRMSPATWLLFAFELKRGAHLTALALSSINNQNGKPEVGGRAALGELFSQVNGARINSLPAVLPEEARKGSESSQPLAGIFLTEGDSEKSPILKVGIVSAIDPNPGWSAPFLHRRDVYSRMHVNFCDVYGEAVCVPRGQVQVLRPYDFVCGVQLRPIQSNGNIFEIAECDVQRLAGMNALLSEERL